MSSVKYQLILREIVFPKYFILSKLKELLEPRQVEIGEFDLDDLKNIIKINYYTEYAGSNRQILSFTIDFSILEPLGLSVIKDMILELGKLFMQCEQVEGVFRFEDYYTKEEIIKLHSEIYDIELKLREVLSYILSYNLPENSLYDFIKEFDGPKFANSKIRSDQSYRENLWSEFMENDLFYISFTEYGYFNKPKALDSKFIYNFISRSNNFDELKEKIRKRGISDEVNENHLVFISNLSTNLNPIENIRNEIMHNRAIKENDKLQQLTSFNKAKDQLLDLIKDFWEKEEEYKIANDKQINYIIDTIIDGIVKQGKVYKYNNLDFEEQVANSKRELISQIAEIIKDNIPNTTIDLNEIIENKIRNSLD